MPIAKGSRYAATPTLEVPAPDGGSDEMLDIRTIPSVPAVFAVTPIDTDRLDLLADRYYRDPLKFWRICDAAPEMDPFDALVPGRPLAIPPNR